MKIKSNIEFKKVVKLTGFEAWKVKEREQYTGIVMFANNWKYN